jgi:hypothetical protein
MRRFIAVGIFAVIVGLLWNAPARAQYGGGYGYGPFGGAFGGGGYGGGGWGGQNWGGGPYAPNFYNPQNQPLSPYLNLLRGNNTAVNYYYGARPGLPSGGYMMPYGVSPGAFGPQTFFQQIDTIYDQAEEDNKTEPGMRPTGHVFGFQNSMGYFGYGGGFGMGMRNQLRSQGSQQSGQTSRTGIR